ncbi:MAG TPA: isoamylase early set domain-containing protein [Gemmatimonadales bacterium]|nr:isoamylase early set domain-containing protein [Gemmatimonadales bacterium]
MHGPADDSLIARVAEELRRPVAARPGFDERVMAAVRAEAPSLPARAWTWLTEPRSFVVTPLGGLATAAGLAALVIAGVVATSGRERPGAARGAALQPAAVAAPTVVTFVLVAPRATSVALAGDFDGWDRVKLPMRRASAGLWTLDVPLAAGRYRYAFVVDGRRFVADPTAPPAVDDDFGQPTSVVTVSGRAAAGGSL